MPPDSQSNVFIIESSTMRDEWEGQLEGKIVADVLRMCNRRAPYAYVRNKSELLAASDWFVKSKCRFLHISCHGNETALGLTLEDVSYGEFAKIFEGKLKQKRLFVSACSVGNASFRKAVLEANNKGMHSVLAPVDPIAFDKAVAFWAAFYVKAFSIDDARMKAKVLQTEALQPLCELFELHLRFDWYSPGPTESWEEITLKGGAGG